MMMIMIQMIQMIEMLMMIQMLMRITIQKLIRKMMMTMRKKSH